MRTVVLSDERIIKFLNDNFINTWVPNSELGRIPSLRDPIATRREREGKTFDTSNTLAQAIIKGWNKYSPVDCLVISHKFEVMGSLHFNLFFNRLGKAGDKDDYLLFLKESLEGKQPGLAIVVLSSEDPSREVLDIFQTSTVDSQDSNVVVLDTSTFENGGTITIDIEIASGKVEGEFCLFDGDSEVPTEERLPKDILARVQLQPHGTGQITHRFDRGKIFKLRVTGHRDEEEKRLNGFHAIISVKEN